MVNFGCMSALVATSALAADMSVPPRPNLLFMMADQMRWDALSLTAGPENKAFRTPNLDRIAGEGISLHAYSSLPTCVPARASLLTGRSPWNHGLLGVGKIAPNYTIELPKVFDAAGYRTAVIGKDHFGFDNGTARPHGFQSMQIYDGLNIEDDYDRWFRSLLPGVSPKSFNWNSWKGRQYGHDEFYHPTAWVGRNAVDFIQSYPNATDGVQPFLLKVSFHRPHSPYDPPARLLDNISAEDLRPKKMCKRPNGPINEGHGEAWCARYRGNVSLGDPSGCVYDKAQAFCGVQPEPDHTIGRRAYAASVNFVDEWVGHIYDALAERQLLQRTWILWTADHGDAQGDMYHMKKGTAYEFTARVPMLLRWPESWETQAAVPRGTVLGAPIIAELRDVLHTFVDAAGLARNATLMPPSEFTPRDGKSLLCLLRDPSGAHCDYSPNPGSWRSYLDLEHNGVYNVSNHWSALTDGKTKYIFRAYWGDEQLFDLVEDPDETNEISANKKYRGDVLPMWRSRMVQQFQEEGRGQRWVVNGTLVGPRQGCTFGPNYPDKTIGHICTPILDPQSDVLLV